MVILDVTVVAVLGCLDWRTKNDGSCHQRTKHGREELPHVGGRGRSREDPMPEGRWPRGVTQRLRSRAVAKSARLQQRRNGREELPKSEVRGGGREELPNVQGAVAARAQEGLEELSHVEGQEGRW